MGLSDKSLSLFSRDVFVYTAKIITGIIVARMLGPEGLGIWIILQMLPSYSEAFGRLKFDIASVYFLGKGKYGLGEITFFLNITSIISSLVLISLFVPNIEFFDKYLLKSMKIDRAIIYLVLAYIPLHFITMNYQYLLIYFENTRAYNVLVVTQGIVGSLISIVLLVVFNLGILAMAIGMVSGGILAMFYGYRQISKIEKMKFRFNRGLLIDMVKYSYNLYISGLIGHFNAYLSGLIVAILMSPAYVSFYQLGKARAELLNRIPSAIGTILYPVVSKSGKSGINASELTALSFRVSLILLTFFGVIGSLLIYPFTVFLYGREFIPLTTAFWILIPSVIIFGSSSLVSQYFLGIGRPDINLKIALIPVLPQVIFCYLLIPLFGVVGAAVSTALTFILLTIIKIIVFKKIVGLTYRFIFIPNHGDIEIVCNFIKRKMNTIIKTVNPNWRFFKIGVEKVNSFAKDRMKP